MRRRRALPPGTSLPILQSVSDDLAQELQKTFDFFIATTFHGKDRSSSSSPAGPSRVVNLDTQLKERFGIPVEIMNPFRQIDVGDRCPRNG